jgi:hypothetical protein
MSSQAVVPIPSDATVGDVTAAPAQDGSQSTVPIPDGATVGDVQPDSGDAGAGPDLRPQRINQRTGQPTTLEDPEGIDSIPSDPHLLLHSVQGAAEGAAAVAPVLIPAGAAEVAGAVRAGLTALVPAATKGVQSVTAWAADHPTTAKLLWEGLKLAVYQHALTKGAASLAGKVINAAPE